MKPTHHGFPGGTPPVFCLFSPLGEEVRHLPFLLSVSVGFVLYGVRCSSLRGVAGSSRACGCLDRSLRYQLPSAEPLLSSEIATLVELPSKLKVASPTSIPDAPLMLFRDRTGHTLIGSRYIRASDVGGYRRKQSQRLCYEKRVNSPSSCQATGGRGKIGRPV